MNPNLFTALVGAGLNMALAVVVPCLMKKTEQPILKEFRTVFENNRQLILASSLIIAITIYVALEYSNDVKDALGELSDTLGLSEPSTNELATRLKYFVA